MVTAQVAQHGVGLEQDQISVLQLGQLAEHLHQQQGGHTHTHTHTHTRVSLHTRYTGQRIPGGCDWSTRERRRSTHTGGLQVPLLPFLHAHQHLLKLLALVGQHDFDGAKSPWKRRRRNQLRLALDGTQTLKYHNVNTTIPEMLLYYDRFSAIHGKHWNIKHDKNKLIPLPYYYITWKT